MIKHNSKFIGGAAKLERLSSNQQITLLDMMCSCFALSLQCYSNLLDLISRYFRVTKLGY